MTQKTQVEPVVYNSLGLQELCQRIRESGACDILELGPVRNGNIQFWSQFGPSLFIADLRSSLPLPVPAAAKEEEMEIPEPDWDRLLGLPEGRSYNVILAWDLMNYLELPVVSSLIRYLKRFCRPGAVLFALIFDQKQMPEEVTVYRVVDESHLAYEYASPELRVCPRHQPRALSGIMCQFKTASSFRLRNGIVEYLFAYEGEKNS